MKTMMRRMLAAVSAVCCAAACVPTAAAAEAVLKEEAKVIFTTDFEDGDTSAFSKRGDTDTSVLSVVDDEAAGSKVLAVTGRSKGWNGPQIQVDKICEPGVRYIVTCKVKAAWYNQCNVSMQYTPNGSDEAKYGNLVSATSQGDWVEMTAKFSYSTAMHDVFIYVEGQDAADLFVDDFTITKAPVYGIEEDIPGLKDVYAGMFKIGGAVTADELSPDTTKELILKHYNSITLGNELKPENMLDQAACQAYAADGEPGKVAVKLNADARTILDFCRDNKIPVRGHVLVWHSQTPGWFFKEDYTKEGEWVDKETMIARMESYIQGVFAVLEEEYPDVDFYAWDVVNEAWLDDGKPRQGGMYDDNANYSGWTQVFGDNSFIPYAFRFARKYAPEGCKLYYNDFNEYMQGKREAIIQMAEELKAEGTIDGIGMQSHLAAVNTNDVSNMTPFPTVNVYKAAIDKFAATGLDVQITELDATIHKEIEQTPEVLEYQAQYYSDIMDCIVAQADSVSAVVFWGTTDDMSWRAWGSPLLFNEDYSAKPAFYSIIDGITPPETVPTEAPTKAPTEEDTTEPQDGPGTTQPNYGDVDESGVVDILDVIALNKSLLGGLTLSKQGGRNADVDMSGTVDTTDALNVLKAVVKLVTLPVKPE